jgi:phospholipid/cholesterol/gamma-HCH transport system substrate-binding protein
VLVTDNSEGVIPGMDMSFAGFPIGRVRQVDLGQDGKVNILVDVPKDDAKWLRTTSVFTLESSVVGETRLRAYSGILTDAAAAGQGASARCCAATPPPRFRACWPPRAPCSNNLESMTRPIRRSATP